jgi:hypothetical protein
VQVKASLMEAVVYLSALALEEHELLIQRILLVE